MVVARADQPPLAIRVPRRSDDASVPRDHLPGPLRPGPGGTASGAGRCLRTGRAQRKPRGRHERRGQIPDMVMISERPAEAEDRAVPGHWEGDLLIGKDNNPPSAPWSSAPPATSCCCTCPKTSTAEPRAGGRATQITTLPAHLRRSVTWDQGKEMGQHLRSPSTPTRRLLLRPPQPLAARQQREHQWASPPVLPQGHRPVRPQSRSPGPGRRFAQQPPPRDTWLAQALGEAHRAPPCDDRLSPPGIVPQKRVANGRREAFGARPRLPGPLPRSRPRERIEHSEVDSFPDLVRRARGGYWRSSPRAWRGEERQLERALGMPDPGRRGPSGPRCRRLRLHWPRPGTRADCDGGQGPLSRLRT